MRQRIRSVAVLGAISLASAGVLVASTSTTATAAGFGYSHLNAIQKRLISGTAAFELDTSATGQAARSARTATSAAEHRSSHHVSGGYGSACSKKLGSNVKVNQNCLNLTDADLQGRGQAQNETSIAVDPNNREHIVASYNDYRRGDGTCGASYSLDGGRTWARHHDPERLHPRRRRRRGPRVLAGRRRHLGRLGHQGQRLPVVPGVQPRRRRPRRTPTSPAPSTCSAPPAPTARRGTSPAARWPSSTTPPARARRCSTSSC